MIALRFAILAFGLHPGPLTKSLYRVFVGFAFLNETQLFYRLITGILMIMRVGNTLVQRRGLSQEILGIGAGGVVCWFEVLHGIKFLYLLFMYVCMPVFNDRERTDCPKKTILGRK